MGLIGKNFLGIFPGGNGKAAGQPGGNACRPAQDNKSGIKVSAYTGLGLKEKIVVGLPARRGRRGGKIISIIVFKIFFQRFSLEEGRGYAAGNIFRQLKGTGREVSRQLQIFRLRVKSGIS